MKALGTKSLRAKVEKETDKYMKEHYEELAYHAVCGQAPIIMKQTEAAVLYALSLHGYGAKRLHDFHAWYCEIMNMPEIMGKKPKLLDVADVLKKKYDLDLDGVPVRFPSFEEYSKNAI